MNLLKSKLLFLCVLALCVLIALPNLFETFSGDQAFFTVYARQIGNGALLYRDLWDVKQPGVFIFYLIAGKLFGFTEIGIHFFELLYLLLFSIILLVTLKDYFQNDLFVLLTPILTVGTYYAVCESLHLTQTEGLVGFPIYLTMWTTFKSLNTNQRRWLVLSGLCGGVVIIFKQIFLLIIAGFWLTTLIASFIKQRKESAETSFFFLAIQTALPIAVGMLLPLLAVVVYFAWHNQLNTLAYITFVYPNQAIATLTEDSRKDILIAGFRWFLIKFASLIFLTSLGAFIYFVTTSKETGKSLVQKIILNLCQVNLITVNLVLWLLVGFVVVLAQRLSWWEYHYTLFFVPLGILTAKGIEIIWAGLFEKREFFSHSTGKLAFALLISLLLVPSFYRIVRKTKNNLGNIISFVTERQYTPKGEMAAEYKRVSDDISFLNDPNSYNTNIFVIGQPLYYYLSNRPPALASNGWMPEFFLKEQWQKLNEEIVEKKPTFVFIDHFLFELTKKRSPETIQLIENRYHLRSKNSHIFCYEIMP